ncbi:MAG: hypothetical protein JJ871_19045 [Thalassospira sp.]|uniref:reverse transcriptase domain-containing protein n=1 Tax=Thalassospira sp. TaxID=1912094 RepID=UPI001B1F1825|nr:reverse transcriptase domain-containing protein [Thalassospira sp.]MBO6581030.1 hypothetical protein [Thalassospira sp.]MBO6819319.1 hypothetical protein [Thalassospira sp.]MBO6890142.1 hypothetical protein [Thalassospira sp.]
MQTQIKNEIKRLSRKVFEKKAREEAKAATFKERFRKRTGIEPASSRSSGTGKFYKHFDPGYCARNANFLAKVLWYKVREFEYEPTPAINYQIPKPDGGQRSIMSFSIPDAALANVVFRRTRERNLKKLSPHSYAYHPERNVFDAVLALKNFPHEGKFFSVQIDFEKYFDNIPIWYIKDRLHEPGLLSITPHERFIFEQFLRHRSSTNDQYSLGVSQRRFMGTPQGSSVSLLLANLANHELDVALSSQAGAFVRFADDVVAICNEYEQAQRIENCFHSHCERSGLKINKGKSPGIAIVSPKSQEMRTTSSIDFLGYKYSDKGLSIPEKAVKKFKTKVSRLLNIYLINGLKHGFNLNRAALAPYPYDWDLLGFVYELRKSLYGGLSESEISMFLSRDSKKLRKMKGLMGFYCLLDDSEVLENLDGWMVNTVRRAIKKRQRILSTSYGADCPTPNNYQLITGAWLDLRAWRREAGDPEVLFPSMVRGWRAARKHYFTFGLEGVQAPNYGDYSDFSSLFDYV